MLFQWHKTMLKFWFTKLCESGLPSLRAGTSKSEELEVRTSWFQKLVQALYTPTSATTWWKQRQNFDLKVDEWHDAQMDVTKTIYPLTGCRGTLTTGIWKDHLLCSLWPRYSWLSCSQQCYGRQWDVTICSTTLDQSSRTSSQILSPSSRYIHLQLFPIHLVDCWYL